MHEHHRARVKSRFENQTLDGFEEHQVLEMMLFYAIPRKDTNEIAHRLIDRFGSFPRVMDAPIEEIEKIEGIGHESALLIKFIRDTYRYYNICKAKSIKQVKSIQECVEYFKAYLHGRKNEEVYLLCLDGKCRVLNCVKVDEGDFCSVRVSTRKIVNIAIAENATSVMIAHNHPGGFSYPSGEDQNATYEIARMLKSSGVYLTDHIVISDEECVSFLQSGLYSPEKTGLF